MEDQNDKPPPSLDLAFDWVKGIFDDQSRTADALDTKAATFFSIATVVLGVGVLACLLTDRLCTRTCLGYLWARGGPVRHCGLGCEPGASCQDI